MKTILKLESIEKTVGLEFANIICELSENQYLDKETVTVKLRCTHHAIRIVSDHLVGEMKHICENLDTTKIKEFVKEMFNANKILKQAKTI